MSNRIQNIEHEATRQFASACYDSNTILQLLDAPDPEVEPEVNDLEIHGLTGDQWREACTTALLELVEDADATLIDDGEEIHLVRIDDLLRHLNTEGWIIDSPWVHEPEHDQDADPYADLCSQIPAVAATGEGDNRAGLVLLRDEADIPTVTWREDQRTWALYDPDDLLRADDFSDRVYRIENGEAVDVSDHPLRNPVDGANSILVIATSHADALRIARQVDAGSTAVYQPDNVEWHGATIVAARCRAE